MSACICCNRTFDEAIVWLEKSRSAVPAGPSTPSRLVAAFALESENKPAAELAEPHRQSIDDRFSSSRRLKPLGSLSAPTARVPRCHCDKRIGILSPLPLRAASRMAEEF
jgi:hypothetical protein